MRDARTLAAVRRGTTTGDDPSPFVALAFEPAETSAGHDGGVEIFAFNDVALMPWEDLVGCALPVDLEWWTDPAGHQWLVFSNDPEPRCAGTRADGMPCSSAPMRYVDDGWCWLHAPPDVRAANAARRGQGRRTG